MGTITFEVHPITLTSPRKTLATIFKSILIIFFFGYSLHIFILSISCMDIKEREEIPNYVKLKHHNFAMSKHTDVLHDWRALVVR